MLYSGTAVYTTQVRNGAQIAYIDNEPYYDFNYQNFNFLSTPVTLLPASLKIIKILSFLILLLIKGDTIQTTCVYTTSSSTSYVVVFF